jgi:hypothetical protein
MKLINISTHRCIVRSFICAAFHYDATRLTVLSCTRMHLFSRVSGRIACMVAALAFHFLKHARTEACMHASIENDSQARFMLMHMVTLSIHGGDTQHGEEEE